MDTEGHDFGRLIPLMRLLPQVQGHLQC
uniref:Uncharacterized protein n=1 Tax=Anguilla anguilla TaxID=7936 RepID=A0A0E9S2B9_ANGAN